MSESLPSREVGRRNRETKADARSPLSTKPVLKSLHAGCLNSGLRNCSADTSSARECDYIGVKS